MTYKKTGIFLLLGLLGAVYLTGCGSPVEVPNLQRLTEVQVKGRAVDSGFTLKEEFASKRRSGNEIVINQYPFPGKMISRGDTVTVQMVDEDFELAVIMASMQIQTAIEKIKECRAVGIDVSDLMPSVAKAQTLYRSAKTIEELVGPTGSTFYANTVINTCDQRYQQKISGGSK